MKDLKEFAKPVMTGHGNTPRSIFDECTRIDNAFSELLEKIYKTDAFHPRNAKDGEHAKALAETRFKILEMLNTSNAYFKDLQWELADYI